jgi:hypothetical protein
LRTYITTPVSSLNFAGSVLLETPESMKNIPTMIDNSKTHATGKVFLLAYSVPTRHQPSDAATDNMADGVKANAISSRKIKNTQYDKSSAKAGAHAHGEITPFKGTRTEVLISLKR